MFKYLRRKQKKGQSTLEYAVLIVIVIGAMLSMSQFIKRGIQGRLRSSADDIGDQFTPGGTSVNYFRSTNSAIRETASQAGFSRSMINAEQTVESENLEVTNTQREFWGVQH